MEIFRVAHDNLLCVQVIHRPSIGRYTKLEEPKARESLLTPSMRRSASKSSLSGDSGTTIATSTSSTLSINIQADPSKNLPSVPDSARFSSLPMVQAANAALMERTPFAIDDAKDDDEESDDDLEGETDDEVLDEVSFTFQRV